MSGMKTVSVRKNWLSLAVASAIGLSVSLSSPARADREVPHIVEEAKVVAESSKKASFVAPEKGQVWLYDVNEKKPVQSITLNKGNTYGFDVKESRLYVNSKEGSKFDFNPDHSYRIYYVTAEDRDAVNGPPGDARTTRRDRERDKPSMELDRNAAKVAESDAKTSFTLKEDGQVWLFDANDKKVIDTARLEKGQSYGFDVKRDVVYRNNEKGDSLEMNADHTFAIYFMPAERRSDRSTEARREDRAPGNTAKVPDTAKVMMEGRDKEFSFVCKERGTAYLWNDSDSQVVNTFNLDTGDRLTISPKSNAIALNGKTFARETELDRKVTYKLLFDVNSR